MANGPYEFPNASLPDPTEFTVDPAFYAPPDRLVMRQDVPGAPNTQVRGAYGIGAQDPYAAAPAATVIGYAPDANRTAVNTAPSGAAVVDFVVGLGSHRRGHRWRTALRGDNLPDGRPIVDRLPHVYQTLRGAAFAGAAALGAFNIYDRLPEGVQEMLNHERLAVGFAAGAIGLIGALRTAPGTWRDRIGGGPGTPARPGWARNWFRDSYNQLRNTSDTMPQRILGSAVLGAVGVVTQIPGIPIATARRLVRRPARHS